MLAFFSRKQAQLAAALSASASPVQVDVRAIRVCHFGGSPALACAQLCAAQALTDTLKQSAP